MEALAQVLLAIGALCFLVYVGRGIEHYFEYSEERLREKNIMKALENRHYLLQYAGLWSLPNWPTAMKEVTADITCLTGFENLEEVETDENKYA